MDKHLNRTIDSNVSMVNGIFTNVCGSIEYFLCFILYADDDDKKLTYDNNTVIVFMCSILLSTSIFDENRGNVSTGEGKVETCP